MLNVTEPEPRFMHSSSMHGDETAACEYDPTCRPSSLNYNVDPLITKLVNGLEIWWINRLQTPTTLTVPAMLQLPEPEGNANNVDIKQTSLIPSRSNIPMDMPGTETIAMMNLGNSTYFNMSANYRWCRGC
ncbi:MAG: hypothetical protein IPN18_06900 [Ignavibacteriales bacterium]|nr:hypothetical protein [Ignavibacteriales bacterium]